jgi:hypothetical protein
MPQNGVPANGMTQNGVPANGMPQNRAPAKKNGELGNRVNESDNGNVQS